jgi:hypothetical protein
MLGDVGQPQPVRAVDGELAVHQVVLGRRAGRATAGSAPVEALDTGLAHEPGNPLVVDRQAQPEHELGMDPWPPVRLAGIVVDLLDEFQQQRILLLADRRWATKPVVVARPRHPKHSTGHRDIDIHIGVVGHLTDQPKPYFGRTFSRAKYAAARLRI